MSYKKLNLISDLYFSLILLSGIFYTVLLFFASLKIIPAFLMQVIFLLDALKFNRSLIELIVSRLFLLNFISGLLLSVLIYWYFQAAAKSLKNIASTKAIISGLSFIKSGRGYLKFKSSDPSVFTFGFIHPQIYLSSAVFGTHRRQEIVAMIKHEINHRNHFHPLKIFIAGFVKSILPLIPGKNWLIDNYLTLVEVSSDQFSEARTNNRLPLVSALLKFQVHSFEPGASYFNSQSERIKILVGQKRQFLKIPLAYYSLVLVVILSGTFFIKNTNIFYDCQHLLKCVELLVAPNSQPLVNTFYLPDHCQQFTY